MSKISIQIWQKLVFKTSALYCLRKVNWGCIILCLWSLLSKHHLSSFDLRRNRIWIKEFNVQFLSLLNSWCFILTISFMYIIELYFRTLNNIFLLQFQRRCCWHKWLINRWSLYKLHFYFCILLIWFGLNPAELCQI